MKLPLFGNNLISEKEAVSTTGRSYSCWKCSSHFTDPADYLWHIQIHE